MWKCLVQLRKERKLKKLKMPKKSLPLGHGFASVLSLSTCFMQKLLFTWLSKTTASKWKLSEKPFSLLEFSVSCTLQPVSHSEPWGGWGQPVLERGSPYVPDGQVSAAQRKKFDSYTSEISIFIALNKEKIHIHIQTYIHVYIQSKDQLFKITILLKHPPLPNCTVM